MMGFARRPLLPIAIFFVVVLSGCLGCFLHQVMRQYFYIATTSFIGSFMMFIGIGSLYGNYPKVLKFDGEITLSLHLYLYQTLLHTGLGMLIQSILPIWQYVKTSQQEEFNNYDKKNGMVSEKLNDKEEQVKSGDGNVEVENIENQDQDQQGPEEEIVEDKVEGYGDQAPQLPEEGEKA